ncbi:MAG: hemolysin family protein [Waddliaceae bacterium]
MTTLFILLLLFLAATAIVNAFTAALRRLRRQDIKLEAPVMHFFYRRLHHFFFPRYEYEGLLLGSLSALTLTRFFFAFTTLLFLFHTPLFEQQALPIEDAPLYDFNSLWIVLSVAAVIFIFFIFGEYLPRLLSAKFPETVLRFCTPIASCLLLIAFPWTYLIIKLSRSRYRALSLDAPLSQTQQELLEMIQNTRLSADFNLHEKKLIESVLRFKDRIAREVMVPRVDVFSLAVDTSIKEAAGLIKEKGYSRIPVYRDTVDNVVGVLMYKDILNQLMKYAEQNNDPSILEAPIETIQKNVLYTPETKKISNLLLEFKKKQVHLAIVVDEYGGTEGVVTIEDILEEIVGEIEDEYDEEEELFSAQHDGAWIVDARMSILDAEQQLGIKIPQEGDYDTIGGYVFHCAGSIPSKGFIIHKEEFKLEVLSSDERRVEKVSIKPVSGSEDVEDSSLGNNPESPEKK